VAPAGASPQGSAGGQSRARPRAQAAWVWKWDWALGEGRACLATMCGLLALNCGMCAWAVCARAPYLRHRRGCSRLLPAPRSRAAPQQALRPVPACGERGHRPPDQCLHGCGQPARRCPRSARALWHAQARRACGPSIKRPALRWLLRRCRAARAPAGRPRSVLVAAAPRPAAAPEHARAGAGRERAGVAVHLAHRVAQAVVTVHGTTQSARYTPLNALMESSFMAANMMLAFGLKVRPHAGQPIRAVP